MPALMSPPILRQQLLHSSDPPIFQAVLGSSPPRRDALPPFPRLSEERELPRGEERGLPAAGGGFGCCCLALAVLLLVSECYCRVCSGETRSRSF